MRPRAAGARLDAPVTSCDAAVVKPLPHDASDAALLEFIDGWAALMEREDYAAAFGYTDHGAETTWSPDLLRRVVKAYGDGGETQTVTVRGVPSDVQQRKEVDRWEPNQNDEVGEIWYDLNIDGVASDLTAIFVLVDVEDGLSIRLRDIHVM